jgi:hypothetical protein
MKTKIVGAVVALALSVGSASACSRESILLGAGVGATLGLLTVFSHSRYANSLPLVGGGNMTVGQAGGWFTYRNTRAQVAANTAVTTGFFGIVGAYTGCAYNYFIANDSLTWREVRDLLRGIEARQIQSFSGHGPSY